MPRPAASPTFLATLALGLACAACSVPGEADDRASVGASATAREAATSPASAPLPSAEPDPPPQPAPPPLPDWMRDTAPASHAATYWARGLRGPLRVPFRGLLVCEVRVSGTWDIAPIGPASQALPDVRVRGFGHTSILPRDQSLGYATFPDVAVDAATIASLEVDDLDDLVSDAIGTVPLSAENGFPLEGRTRSVTAKCVGVPPEVDARDRDAARAAATKAVDAAVATSPAVDPLRPETSHAAIDAARAAVRAWARLVGAHAPEIAAAVDRLERAHEAWRTRFRAEVDVRVAAERDDAGWHELGRALAVRRASGEGRVEIRTSAALVYDWRTKHLGSVSITLLDAEGRREPPVFLELTKDGVSLGQLEATVPPGTAEIRCTSRAGDDPRAIVVESGHDVVVLPFR
jgi:hypothetical protein